LHRNATKSAGKFGGSHIYTCPVGIFFWTSPFFAGERFAGALISSVMPALGMQEVVDRLFTVCKGEISRAELSQFTEGVPAKTGNEVQALAQIMTLCVQQISRRESSLANPAKSMIKNEPDLIGKERLLLVSLQRGDCTEALGIAQDLLSDMNMVCEDDFGRFKLMAIELVVALSRAGSNSENSQELVDTNNRYLKRIREMETAHEITEYVCKIVEQVSGKIFSFRGLRHALALRKAERFIRENYARKLSLKEIADASGLSAPYFSTIFKDEMGENLSGYLNRLRVEKACTMLKETGDSISEISSICGFEDQGWFSKIFKTYTGVSPCKYRKLG
jgi:AraC-like DNA-binding protein